MRRDTERNNSEKYFFVLKQFFFDYLKALNFHFPYIHFFVAAILILNSCVLNTSTNNSARFDDSLSDAFLDTTDYANLAISKDSVDIELIRLIREKDKFSEKKFTENVKILIEKGANPNKNIEETWISRRYVSYIPIVKNFIKRKYNSGVSYTTAFHVAVKDENIKLVQLFFDLGFSCNVPSRDEIFPIDLALKNNDLDMIDLLLEKQVNLKNANLAFSENTDLIIKLVKLGANPKRIDINYALEKPEDLKKLLTLKPDLSSAELKFDILFKNDDVFNLLLDNGLDPNIKGAFPFTCNLLYGAIEYGTLAQVKKVVQKGGNYKTDCAMQFYASPIIASIRVQDTTKIAYFIELGLRVNSSDWKGDTPLKEAITMNNDFIITFLIRKGANVNQVIDSETPIIFAVKTEKYIAAEVLIENKADVNKIDNQNKTCLVYAIEANDLAMTRLLLENGANSQIKYQEKTLADYALQCGASSKIIQLLR